MGNSINGTAGILHIHGEEDFKLINRQSIANAWIPSFAHTLSAGRQEVQSCSHVARQTGPNVATMSHLKPCA
ncbi:MAG TPA: hypothetical protein VJU59_29610 [Paraburkholderia sp.]|uniref:hypothetical protein n=1 Tax=Paraburkholderia sp. TaxID=1926495 RepID=UPI002B45B3EC|nr:hypothetical protein [Paraburkholderia sp.]HKR43785.1 hypothetical protein [Paraburkholderia sp.]